MSHHDEQVNDGREIAGQMKQIHAAAEIPASERINRERSQMLHDLGEQRIVMMNYLYSKMGAEDWHGVADAAMDLREIDAKLSVSMPDARLQRTREALPEGYQFGDMGKPPRLVFHPDAFTMVMELPIMTPQEHIKAFRDMMRRARAEHVVVD